MATLPWTTTTTPHPVADTVVLGSRLELRSFADTRGSSEPRCGSAGRCSDLPARSGCR